MKTTIDGLKAQLAQARKQYAKGALSDAQFAEEKSALERQILELVLATGPVDTPSSAKGKASAEAAAPTARPSALLLAALGVGILVLAGAGYLWKGTPIAPVQSTGEAQMTSSDGQAAPHATTAEQIAAMTDKLAERLKQKPDDVEGWSMLARSYSVLGRHADALKAYQTASNLRKDDPVLLADYADSLAVNNGSNLEGEPMRLVERALKLDPKNLKALYLAGTYDFNRKDYAGAVKMWEKLAASGPPGNVFVNQVQPAIAEARSLAGLPPAAAQPLDGAAAPQAASTGASVSGTVTLSAALAQQAQPEDTVFVFARAVEGSRMPLAILRKQVKDLPIAFNLNDSMAMSPSSALSSQAQVIVGARVSKSGNAMPQPGDLQGQSGPVKVGSTNLKIEIKESIKP